MTAGARLVKMDREESKSVIDMRKAMSRREPSNNVAPTKSTSNLVDGISKISHFLSGENKADNSSSHLVLPINKLHCCKIIFSLSALYLKNL